MKNVVHVTMWLIGIIIDLLEIPFCLNCLSVHCHPWPLFLIPIHLSGDGRICHSSCYSTIWQPESDSGMRRGQGKVCLLLKYSMNTCMHTRMHSHPTSITMLSKVALNLRQIFIHKQQLKTQLLLIHAWILKTTSVYCL